MGELLKQFDARGDHRKSNGTNTSSQKEMAEAAGISKRQQVTAVRVANIPAEKFEAAIENEKPATVTALAEMGKQVRAATEGFKQATHLIGERAIWLAFAGQKAQPSHAVPCQRRWEMIPIKSTDRTPIEELEEMVAKLFETARKLPAGPVRHDILKEIRKFSAQIAALKVKK